LILFFFILVLTFIFSPLNGVDCSIGNQSDDNEETTISINAEKIEFLTEEELNAPEPTQPAIYNCSICPEKTLFSLEQVRRHISSKVRDYCKNVE
jgi:hypothetical protein